MKRTGAARAAERGGWQRRESSSCAGCCAIHEGEVGGGEPRAERYYVLKLSCARGRLTMSQSLSRSVPHTSGALSTPGSGENMQQLAWRRWKILAGKSSESGSRPSLDFTVMEGQEGQTGINGRDDSPQSSIVDSLSDSLSHDHTDMLGNYLGG